MGERILIGRGQVTIQDYTDAKTILAYLGSTLQRQVIYNPNTKEYIPNYGTTPIELVAELYIAGDTTNRIGSAKSVTWYKQINSMDRLIEVKDDSTYKISRDSLTINSNVLEENNSMNYQAKIVYPFETSEGVEEDIIVNASIELVKLSSGAAGEDGSDGVGITNVEEFYLTTNKSEGVTKSESGWDTEFRDITIDERFLWNYEVITYSNGVVIESMPAIIAVHGIHGETGVGIESITENYLAIDKESGVTVDTPGWTTDIQLIDEDNRYLWNYEIIKYTNGDSQETVPVILGVFGQQGVTGVDGVGVESIEEKYLATAQGTGVTIRGYDWKDEVQTITETLKYLWNYEIITYTNGRVVNMDPVILGVYGESGAPGVGIESITEMYLATNQKEGITSASKGWTDGVQEISESLKYLWNYEIAEYTDGNIKETVPVVIGVYAIDGVGVESITEMYLTTDLEKGVTYDTPGWKDTVQQTTVDARYLWNYEIINYTDGKSIKTDPVLIGSLGIDGEDGFDGVGIKSITEMYLISPKMEGITIDTFGWKDFVQTVSKDNKYLWNYEITEYTNDAIETTTPVVIGMYSSDGKDGTTGIGVKSITEKYLASDMKTGVTIKGYPWKNEVQEINAEKRYLWNYEIIEYTDGNIINMDPAVLGVYGISGVDGVDGVGIDSITEMYLATSTKTGVTSLYKGWTDGVQETTATRKYLWNYEITVYTDGDVKETTPVVIGMFTRDGKDSYTHVAYADNANGTKGFVFVNPENKTYIGVYVSDNSDISSDPTLYNWTRIRGIDGTDGEDGTSVTIKGTVDKEADLPTGEVEGDGYIIDGDLWVWDGSKWNNVGAIQGAPGKPGEDGKTPWLHTAYANSADGKKDFSIWDYEDKLYIGQYTNFESGPSSNYLEYKWSRFRGEDGATGVGVESITEKYLATNQSTGITIESHGWKDTVQPISASSKYLWNYEIVTYTDGKVVNMDPAVIGVFGVDGTHGTDGVGIKDIVEMYLAINMKTGVTKSTKGWTEKVQDTTVSTKYLWNYEIIIYTDDSTTETNPKVVGMFTRDGTDGVGIESITEKYLASSKSKGILIGDINWKDTVQEISASKKYLWNYEIITYTDGKVVNMEPAVIGVFGVDGSHGIDGVGISDIVEMYLASSKETGVETGDTGWTNTVQKTDSTKKYLWNYEIIKYTNGVNKPTTPVVIGMFSSDGKPGVGIKSITEMYLATPMKTGVKIGVGNWTPAVQEISETKKYLWNYEIIEYTDGKKINLEPAVVGVFGVDGVGIKSIKEMYLATNLRTGVTRQTSGWKDVVQTISESLKYLWNYEIITYTDGYVQNADPVLIGVFGKDGTDGEDALLSVLNLPDGDTIRNHDNNLTITVSLYKGSNTVNPTIIRWYQLDPSAGGDSLSGRGWRKLATTTDTLMVTPKMFTGTGTYMTIVTYASKHYKNTTTVKDLVDTTVSIIGPNVFKNGKGTIKLTAKVYDIGAEVDTGGTKYNYEWSSYDTLGNFVKTFSTKRKTITITADEVENIVNLQCVVSMK